MQMPAESPVVSWWLVGLGWKVVTKKVGKLASPPQKSASTLRFLFFLFSIFILKIMKKTLKLECTWNIVNCDTRLIGEQTFAWWLLNTEKMTTKNGFADHPITRSPRALQAAERSKFFSTWFHEWNHKSIVFLFLRLIFWSQNFSLNGQLKKDVIDRKVGGISRKIQQKISVLTCTQRTKSLLKSCWPFPFFLIFFVGFLRDDPHTKGSELADHQGHWKKTWMNVRTTKKKPSDFPACYFSLVYDFPWQCRGISIPTSIDLSSTSADGGTPTSCRDTGPNEKTRQLVDVPSFQKSRLKVAEVDFISQTCEKWKGF